MRSVKKQKFAASKPSAPLIDKELLSLLACPACQGKVELSQDKKDDSIILCTLCRHTYPIIDGIPVLLVDPS